MNKRALVFLGPPASGKGTQGRRLAEAHGLAYLSTGALLRRALSDDTELGKKARPFLDRGEFVPDAVMVPMVIEWVLAQENGWLLDGFPRTVPQAEALDAALEVKPSAIVLHVPDDELRRRVVCRLECQSCHRVASEGGGTQCPKCGGLLAPRADDSAANFESRLAGYRRLVKPTIQYYCDRWRARIVNGTGSPDEVWVRVQG
ncbi:nucleoside monophosphate kinase [Verrucomicrobiaceae bacterium 227]